jgi:hypothetical protein
MKHDLKCADNCVVCSQELTTEWKSIMNESEFTQTWCKICILKHGHSYPITNYKIDSIQEVNRLERIIKYKLYNDTAT